MTWDSLCKAHKWPYNSPLLSLTGHNYFPPGNIDPGIRMWNLGTKILLHQVTSPTGIIPLSILLHNSTISTMDQWRYQQLAAFVHSLLKTLRSFSDLTPLEAAFSKDQPVEKPISHFYKILLTLASTRTPTLAAGTMTQPTSCQRSRVGGGKIGGRRSPGRCTGSPLICSRVWPPPRLNPSKINWHYE